MLKIAIRRVVGDSMLPDLGSNDLILVIKTKNFKIDDVVGFIHKKKTLLKRISQVSNGKYFILGDNEANSLDSRKLGWINADQVVFKLIRKI